MAQPARISSTASKVVGLDLARPYAIAGRTITTAECLQVGVRSETGEYGSGAGSPSPAVTGETLAVTQAVAEEALAYCASAGMTPLEIALSPAFSDITTGAPAARAAVEMALLDCAAKKAGVSVYQSLGGSPRRIPTSVTIGILGFNDTLLEAERHIAAGFRHIKLKIGDDLDADLHLLRALRKLVGASVGIRVDANQGYELSEFRVLARNAHSLGIELIEQPLPRGVWRASDRRSLGSTAPIAADEDLHGPEDASNLARSGQYDVFNIKLMKCGGILPALEIGRLADLGGISLMWGCMDESVIGIAAALHAALACPNTRYLDLDGSFDLAADIASGGFVLDRGELSITDAPGLGITLVGDELC